MLQFTRSKHGVWKAQCEFCLTWTAFQNVHLPLYWGKEDYEFCIKPFYRDVPHWYSFYQTFRPSICRHLNLIHILTYRSLKILEIVKSWTKLNNIVLLSSSAHMTVKVPKVDAVTACNGAFVQCTLWRMVNCVHQTDSKLEVAALKSSSGCTEKHNGQF